jgi:outer membrane immunogenic protein
MKLFGLRATSIKYISTGVAALGVLAFSAQADAADIYGPGPGGYKDVPVVVPIPLWTGFYFGANGGFGASANNQDITSFVTGLPDGLAFLNNRPLLSSTGFNSEGAFGGGQIGYNWQGWGNFVFGVETDLQGSSIRSDKDVTPFVAFPGTPFTGQPVPFLTRSLHEDVDWFGTLRGRIGYAWGSALLYGTGGFAYGGVHDSMQTTLLGILPVARFVRSEVDTGWTLGGGVEYKFNPNWSLKVEYQFIDLGSTSMSGKILGFFPAYTNDIEHTFNTVRVGVNYAVGTPYIPLK